MYFIHNIDLVKFVNCFWGNGTVIHGYSRKVGFFNLNLKNIENRMIL